MKVKVEIDISDLVTEVEDYGEVGLHEELLSGIKYELKQSVFKELRTWFLDELKGNINREMMTLVPAYLSDTFEELKSKEIIFSNVDVTGPSGAVTTMQDVTFDQYVESKIFQNLFAFNNRRADELITSQLRKTVDSSISQLKDRYDSYFAMQIVKKVGEQGMLKPGVLESLLPNSQDDINP